MGYCNDTYLQTIFSGRSRRKTIPKRYPKTQCESPGQEVTHPPTHTLEQNIDTLSALVQRIPIPYFMSGSNSLKRGKEEPNKITKQSNKFSTSPWQCWLKMQIRWIDQIQYPISLVASLETVPVICWNSTSFTSIGKVHAHTHTQTNKQTRSFFLTVFAGAKAFSSSTFGRKDFKCGNCGAFVEFGPSSYALYIAGRKTWKTTGDVIVTCFHVGMPPRVKNDIESLQTHPKKKRVDKNFEDASCTLRFKSDGLVGTNQETMEICWKVPWYSINPPRRTGLGKR